MITIKKPIEHKYFEKVFESSIGRKIKEEEKFIILPSLIGFSDDDFRIRIKEEIDFLGLSTEDFAKAVYISYDRAKRLIFSTESFNHSEIKEISRVLGF